MQEGPHHVGTAGEVVRAARAAAGLTQRQMAARAGVSQPVVAAYESGRRQPTIPTLRRLLAAADHDLALTATLRESGRAERSRAASRSRALATTARRYQHSPEGYWSLLVA